MAGIRGLNVVKLSRPKLNCINLFGEKDVSHYQRLLDRYDEILAMPTEEYLSDGTQKELANIRTELLAYVRKDLKES